MAFYLQMDLDLNFLLSKKSMFLQCYNVENPMNHVQWKLFDDAAINYHTLMRVFLNVAQLKND